MPYATATPNTTSKKGHAACRAISHALRALGHTEPSKPSQYIASETDMHADGPRMRLSKLLAQIVDAVVSD